MNYKELSIQNEIDFNLVELKAWEKLETIWNKIVTVIEWEILDREKWKLNTFESSVYHTWEIEAQTDSLLTVFDINDINQVLNKIDVDNDFWEYCRSNWTQLRKLYDIEWFEKIDLYRSDQIKYEFNWVKYKSNLWFCGPNTNCRWHNQHDFIEIHTNIAWDWFMQKALHDEWKQLIETVHLWVWSSHRKFNIENEFEWNWNPKYPFHRWLGWNTWNIWLVIEKY